MRVLFFLLLSVLPMTHAIAQVDLETDDRFFKEQRNPYEEDDLDRAYKNRQSSQSYEQLKNTDVTIKDEMGTTSPGLMSPFEASSIDRQVINENKRRQQRILQTVAANSYAIKTCIDQNRKGFQGSQITLAWLIDPSGKVLNADIRSTDFNSPEAQNCVKDYATRLDFRSAATHQYKKSLVEYTYRVKLKQSQRRPASSSRITHQARK
jgi:hypothetical protein